MTVSQLSFGCHNLTGGSSWRRSHRLVRCALDLGIRRFDVAPSYGLGTAERTLSYALGQSRYNSNIEITTKFGIAAPRYGRLASWIREPYRGLRQLRPSPTFSSSAWHSVAPRPFKGTALQAADASLRALRVDRIGVFLSHERLDDELAKSFGDAMLDLQRRGMVARVGCSGDVSNISYMLDRAKGAAEILQVPLHQQAQVEAQDKREIRIFNIGKIARKLLQNETFAVVEPDLVDAIPSTYQLDRMGACMAGVLVWLRITCPSAVLIINASTEQRLVSLVSATSELTLGRWASSNRDYLRAEVYRT